MSPSSLKNDAPLSRPACCMSGAGSALLGTVAPLSLKSSPWSAEIALQIQFYDLDPMEIVWHGRYVEYLENARCALFDQIEQWLEPVKAPNLLEVSREAYVAFGPSTPVETSTFKTEKLSIVIAGKPVEFVPDVMGSAGQISLAVMGLTAARYGSISLVGLANGEWQWRKTNGLKDPDTFVFDANFLAQQLQSLIPRDRT